MKPKRSWSYRGPAICIISTAQQARPNVMGQREPCLAQFAITSRLALFKGLCWQEVLVCCVGVNWNKTYTAYSAIDDGFRFSD